MAKKKKNAKREKEWWMYGGNGRRKWQKETETCQKQTQKFNLIVEKFSACVLPLLMNRGPIEELNV